MDPERGKGFIGKGRLLSTGPRALGPLWKEAVEHGAGRGEPRARHEQVIPTEAAHRADRNAGSSELSRDEREEAHDFPAHGSLESDPGEIALATSVGVACDHFRGSIVADEQGRLARLADELGRRMREAAQIPDFGRTAEADQGERIGFDRPRHPADGFLQGFHGIAGDQGVGLGFTCAQLGRAAGRSQPMVIVRRDGSRPSRPAAPLERNSS